MKSLEHGLEVVPNLCQIFVHHLEQISDKNITQLQMFKNDFQEYLHLEIPITEQPQNKVFHEAFSDGNICDEEFRDVQQEMLMNARVASFLIQHKFLDSKDVIIGGLVENFVTILNSQSLDTYEQ